MKRILTIAALAAALAVPALAQQQPPPTGASPPAQPSTGTTPSQTATSAQQPGFVQKQDPSEWRGSKLIGATIYGPDNSSIGEVSDLIIGSDGRIKAAVIGVGGFLGVGQKDVAVPFNALNVKRQAGSASIDKITVAFSKDQIKNAPQFAYYAPPSRTPQTTGSGNGAGAPRPTGTPMSR